MGECRGLLTKKEREAITGDASDSYRYKTRTDYRRRLEKLERDVEVMGKHDPVLVEELRDVVCPHGVDA